MQFTTTNRNLDGDNCPLGLECPGEIYFDECVNLQSCKELTEPWDLYQIFIMADLPPIYLLDGNCSEWTRPEYGFKKLVGDWQWILYYVAAKYLKE